jgi:hypothetical protein
MQIAPQLFDLTAGTSGEHADRAHTGHNLVGRMDDLTCDTSAAWSVCGSPIREFAVAGSGSAH